MATSNSTQSSTQKPTQKPNKQHANCTRLSRIRLSRSGWVWLALSGFAVVVAMQFGQAFAYALACFAPAYLLVAYWQLKRFAQHLQLQKLTLPQHCTQPHFDALLSLDFPTGLGAQTLQVQLQCRSHRGVEVSLSAAEAELALPNTPLCVRFASPERALYRCSQLALQLNDPLGFWQLQHTLPMSEGMSEFISLPKAQITAPFPGSVESEQTQHHDADVSHLRSYQWGDRPDRIHWKASARSDDWLVKTADNTSVNTRAELDYNACRLSDHEDKIAELYGWLLQLHQEQAPYGLKLPGQCIAENRGAAHFHHCVTALAQLDPA